MWRFIVIPFYLQRLDSVSSGKIQTVVVVGTIDHKARLLLAQKNEGTPCNGRQN
jgi:hypothetical protein